MQELDPQDPVNRQLDIDLLRRFEPIVRFTRGEQFFPIDVARYVKRASLWIQNPGEAATCVVDNDELDLARLAESHVEDAEIVQFLKFTDPLDPAELASYYLNRRIAKEERFVPTVGRLARVGYFSRLVDGLFNVALLLRGRVPGDTAAAAGLIYQQMQEKDERYSYHGRVMRVAGWVVLQYWYFYAFNNWRSGFSGANDHEGDWEMVSVYLADDDPDNGIPKGVADFEPQWVAYSSHDYWGDDLRRHWHDPEVEKVGNHPVVYAGAGSHACYYQPGEYLTQLHLSFVAPIVNWLEKARMIWHEQLRQYRDELGQEEGTPATNIFRIPFVDYARGDGYSIGPGQEKEWSSPRLLTLEEEWVAGYRGLWGLYARDPFAGENAPAGPMYNRDRTIRHAWYDPVGWSGLDKLPTPANALKALQGQLAQAEAHHLHLHEMIEQKGLRLQQLGIAAQALREQAHLLPLFAQYAQEMDALSAELRSLREETAMQHALSETLATEIEELQNGKRRMLDPAVYRRHIHHAHTPTPVEVYAAGRWAETWAAASIGLMLVIVVGLMYFSRQHVIFGLAAMLVVFAVLEATFRSRLARFVTSVTLGMTIAAMLVLIYEFFWPLVAIGVVGLGTYLLWENLRELWQ